jgi:hypothetical protein
MNPSVARYLPVFDRQQTRCTTRTCRNPPSPQQVTDVLATAADLTGDVLNGPARLRVLTAQFIRRQSKKQIAAESMSPVIETSRPTSQVAGSLIAARA